MQPEGYVPTDGAPTQFGGPTDPTNFLTYYNRGVAHQKLGEYDKSIAEFTRAIEKHWATRPLITTGLVAEAYRKRGLAYLLLGDTDKAEADFARAKELGFEP